MKRRKKAKLRKAEAKHLKRLRSVLLKIFLDENGIVRWPDGYHDTRRHSPQRAGQ